MADLSKIKAGLQSSTLKHRRVRHSSLISPDMLCVCCSSTQLQLAATESLAGGCEAARAAVGKPKILALAGHQHSQAMARGQNTV